jgi:hypothetical protein
VIRVERGLVEPFYEYPAEEWNPKTDELRLCVIGGERDQVGMSDKSTRRVANVVKGVARDQRQFRPRTDLENINGIRGDDFRRVDYVAIGAGIVGSAYFHPGRDFSERPKKSVAVACEAYGPEAAQLGGAWNMTQSAKEAFCLIVLQHRNRELQRRNFNAADQISGGRELSGRLRSRQARRTVTIGLRLRRTKYKVRGTGQPQHPKA